MRIGENKMRIYKYSVINSLQPRENRENKMRICENHYKYIYIYIDKERSSLTFAIPVGGLG